MTLDRIKYFLALVNEALPLSVAKNVSRFWDKKRYDKLFGGKYRIYLDIGTTDTTIEQPSNRNFISNLISNLGYVVVDYIAGTARKKDSTSSNIIKIGKILSDTNLAGIGYHKDEFKDIRNQFLNDPMRVGSKIKKEKLLAVISRHPYDVAGMSTDRGWSSCMKIDNSNAYTLRDTEIGGGTIVAYLIRESDKNIKNPIGRIAIKPFISNQNKVVLVPCQRSYGTIVPEFFDTVNKWIFDNWNKNAPEDRYFIQQDVYAGDYDSRRYYNIKEPVHINTAKDLIAALKKDTNITFGISIINPAEKYIVKDYKALLQSFTLKDFQEVVKLIKDDYDNTIAFIINIFKYNTALKTDALKTRFKYLYTHDNQIEPIKYMITKQSDHVKDKVIALIADGLENYNHQPLYFHDTVIFELAEEIYDDIKAGKDII